ncbi:unnamed protein product [Didymodactylos carnosus]|uniref:Uncharacterized protein n=1 Tax=Didymodactylos carnosus TaxID=1234261 RepID=A0A814ZEI1_9BILA|nr:unnamed protein product [Didymodactylos carnosus]CAF1242746.1 unnamed protein product [Didymodactylos carnosus]CAF3693323.1 unnamed protein product [Didymodactylos carnosus]CAF4006618.1 unnamed protein product [Didymodactylos carnosus]
MYEFYIPSAMGILNDIFIHEFTEQPVLLCNRKKPKLLYQLTKAVLQKYLQEKFGMAFLEPPNWTLHPHESALIIDGALLLQVTTSECHGSTLTSAQYIMNEESILCVGEDYNKLLRDNRAVVAKAVRDAWLKLCLKIPADKVLYVAGLDEEAFMINSSGFILIPELQSNQNEADTRIFLHIQHIQSFQHISQATIQATDTDVLVLAIGFAVEYRLNIEVI